jgi:hypothetical protein
MAERTTTRAAANKARVFHPTHTASAIATGVYFKEA